MKKLSLFACLALLGAALLTAAHHESSPKAVASVHDLMEDVVKPNMDVLAAMKKRGGPQSEQDWKKSKSAASLIGEGAQLMLHPERVKDEAWTGGAEKSIEGAAAVMAAAEKQDTEAWMAGLTMTGQGCRTCHKPHKPKKK